MNPKTTDLKQKTKTINIQVLFFATLRDLFKTEKIKLEINEGSTIKELRDKLFSSIDNSEKLFQTTLYAINHDFASLNSKLKEGDEVAFLPFVSGG